MTDVAVTVGESAKFHTKVEAGQDVTVKWYLNGNEATGGQQNSKYKVERSGNSCELTIYPCFKNYSGSVSAVAENEVAEDKKIANIFVGGA